MAALLRRRHFPVGRVVGRAYAANTLGTIIGSGAAGFLLVPAFGLRGAIVAAVLLNAAVGTAWLLAGRWRALRLRVAAAAPPGPAASRPAPRRRRTGWERE